MVNRTTTEPIECIKIYVFSKDLDFLRRKFGSGASPHERVGYGPAMRTIIHTACNKLREKERLQLDQMYAFNYPESDVEMETSETDDYSPSELGEDL